ncbi:MAG: hypothetical protein FD165_1105 [Gammaproteobacteria bacterium]|nr:MAG: hypothetical protein FD165_1105 [Gammaproteobacteria bacterium]TND07264.1 MAG: hypothetical protein FD120_2 [Gammaproteobacteria bacterium]
MPTGSHIALMRVVVITMVRAACTMTTAVMFIAFRKNKISDDFLASLEFFLERLFERSAVEISKCAA